MIDHPWFKGVDWEGVMLKEIPPPWVPELKSQTDFSYFDDYPDSGDQARVPTPSQQAVFADF